MTRSGCEGKDGERGFLTNRRDGRDDLTKLELVEDGRLSGGIESNHQDTHLLLSEETRDCFSTTSRVRRVIDDQVACSGSRGVR